MSNLEQIIIKTIEKKEALIEAKRKNDQKEFIQACKDNDSNKSGYFEKEIVMSNARIYELQEMKNQLLDMLVRKGFIQ